MDPDMLARAGAVANGGDGPPGAAGDNDEEYSCYSYYAPPPGAMGPAVPATVATAPATTQADQSVEPTPRTATARTASARTASARTASARTASAAEPTPRSARSYSSYSQQQSSRSGVTPRSGSEFFSDRSCCTADEPRGSERSAYSGESPSASARTASSRRSGACGSSRSAYSDYGEGAATTLDEPSGVRTASCTASRSVGTECTDGSGGGERPSASQGSVGTYDATSTGGERRSDSVVTGDGRSRSGSVATGDGRSMSRGSAASYYSEAGGGGYRGLESHGSQPSDESGTDRRSCSSRSAGTYDTAGHDARSMSRGSQLSASSGGERRSLSAGTCDTYGGGDNARSMSESAGTDASGDNRRSLSRGSASTCDSYGRVSKHSMSQGSEPYGGGYYDDPYYSERSVTKQVATGGGASARSGSQYSDGYGYGYGYGDGDSQMSGSEGPEPGGAPPREDDESLSLSSVASRPLSAGGAASIEGGGVSARGVPKRSDYSPRDSYYGYSYREGGSDGDDGASVGGDGYSDYDSYSAYDDYGGYSKYSDYYGGSASGSGDKYSYSGYSGGGGGGSGGGGDDSLAYDYYGDSYGYDKYDEGYGDDDDDKSLASSEPLSGLSQLSSYEEGGDVLGRTTPASKLAAAAAAGAAAGAAAVASLPRVDEEDDGTYVGLGIQLQEPTDGGTNGGFVVTKLIRGAPGDKCGLILEGDILVTVDGRSIAPMRFSEVSALLAGPEGVPISLQFERTVGEGVDARTRTYDVALRRERFYLEEGEDSEDDDASDASMLSAGGGRAGRKADYWEGYRAAMAQKAPPFATSIASFESDDDDDDDALSSLADLPGLPRSPSASEASDEPSEIEVTTEQQLSGALAAGATVGLPVAEILEPLPTAAELDAKAKSEAEAEREQVLELSANARKWAERMGGWDATLKRDLEGMSVKSELLSMWKLKLTRVRAKLGIEEKAVAAQEAALAEAKLPPPRDAEGGKSTAEVLRVVREGGKEGTAELLTELQRQMVEAERWRAETKRMGAQLKKARDEITRRAKEATAMRAQNVTWSSDNKQRRMQVQSAKAEAEELRQTNSAVVAQAATLEERVAKLQDEVTLKSELAAMWRRSAETGPMGGGGGGGGGEAEAAALTWKLEAEKAMREGERWKALARRSDEAMRTRDDEALKLKMELEEARLGNERKVLSAEYQQADERPLGEVKQALLAAQDDLQAKAEEASHLSAKVARLEKALNQLM